MPLSAARREQESARLGRELYIAEQKPSILKLGKAAIDEGGGMAHMRGREPSAETTADSGKSAATSIADRRRGTHCSRSQ